MSEKLKPCPWCDENNLGTYSDEHGLVSVICNPCDAAGPSLRNVAGSLKIAYEKWNHRPREDAARREARLEIVKAMNNAGIDPVKKLLAVNKLLETK